MPTLLSCEEINQRLHYFNLTNDWSVFSDVSAIQAVSVMYPESTGLIGETVDQKKQRLINEFGPLNEEWKEKLGNWEYHNKTFLRASR